MYQSRYCCIVVRCSAVLMCPFKGLISMSVTDCCQNLWLLPSHVVSDVRLGIVFVVFICYFVTVFLCLPQARVAGGGGMFSCCPFVRLFVHPSVRASVMNTILKANELISIQIGTTGAGFPRVLKSREFWVFKIHDLKSPEIGPWCWKSHEKVLKLASSFLKNQVDESVSFKSNFP